MKYYVINTFTNELFSGNPAGVCILEKEIPEEMMFRIAKENRLIEMSFVWKVDDSYRIRWFTPNFEIDWSGHATLAAACVIFNFLEPETTKVTFQTLSGIIEVRKKDHYYYLYLPIWKPKKIILTTKIVEALGVTPLSVYSGRDLFVELSTPLKVTDFVPDFEMLNRLTSWMGVVLTAKGDRADFVSRYFCTELGLEDAVTGSSHCSLIPFWSERLGKKKLIAEQLSERGGTLYCALKEDCVRVSGAAVLYIEGEMKLG